MNHEILTPFPVPEIHQDDSSPPRLMDLEFQTHTLADLIEQLCRGREVKLDHIAIQGGLLLDESIFGVYERRHELYDLENDAQVKDVMLYAIHRLTLNKKLGFVTGYYDTKERSITMNPDTHVLLSLLFPSLMGDEVASVRPVSVEQFPTTSLQPVIQERIEHTLLEELEHSCQNGIQHTPSLTHIVPLTLLNWFFDKRARRNLQHPRCQQLAQEAITLKPLISDEQLLDYALFARSIPGNQGPFFRK